MRRGSQASTLRPITRSSDAVGSSARLVVRRVPAQRRAPGQREALALEQRPHRVEQRARLGLVERRARRGRAACTWSAADVPVRRRQQAPGAVAGVDAVARRQRARPRAGAPSAPASPSARGERALVRRRQAVFVAAVARGCGAMRASSALELRQRAGRARTCAARLRTAARRTGSAGAWRRIIRCGARGAAGARVRSDRFLECIHELALRTGRSAGATRAPAAPAGATASSPSSPASRCSASRSASRR